MIIGFGAGPGGGGSVGFRAEDAPMSVQLQSTREIVVVVVPSITVEMVDQVDNALPVPCCKLEVELVIIVDRPLLMPLVKPEPTPDTPAAEDAEPPDIADPAPPIDPSLAPIGVVETPGGNTELVTPMVLLKLPEDKLDPPLDPVGVPMGFEGPAEVKELPYGKVVVVKNVVDGVYATVVVPV